MSKVKRKVVSNDVYDLFLTNTNRINWSVGINDTDQSYNISTGNNLTSTALNILPSKAISLTGAAASNFTTSSGLLTLDGASGVSILGNSSEIDITTTGAVDINSGAFTLDGTTVSINATDSTNLTLTANVASTKTMTIAASNSEASNVANIDIDADGAVSIDAGAASNFTTSSGALTLQGASGVDIAASGVATTIKGTFNVDEAATFDTTVGVSGILTMDTDKKIQFRDTGLFINSSADGQLDIDADTTLQITAPTVDIDASTEVNISNALTVGGNISGTISTATQNSITTMTGLTSTGALASGSIASGFGTINIGTNSLTTGSAIIDNLTVDGNTITATSGAVNITPAAGSAIVLDGTINVDAGVVTGATSITSTAFVGALTGNADTSTNIYSITNSNIVQLTDTQTLTNKTLTAPVISTIINSGTLTLPASTDTLVGRTTTDTLTNKTLTAPKIVDGGFIADANGNEGLVLGTTASAVNEIKITNAATSNGPIIAVQGDDSNIDLNLSSKGTGGITMNTSSLTVSPTGTKTMNQTETAGQEVTISSGTYNDAETASSGTNGNIISANFIGAPTLTATNTAVTTTSAATLYIDNAPTASTNQLITYPYALYVASGVSRFADITSNGSLVTSDMRLKTNIITIDNPLEKVNKMRGVYFDWKDKEKYNDRKQIGFIAQEVEKVVPELVSEGDKDTKAVNYAQTVALLLEAVKEQNKMVENQNKIIEELRNDIEELKNDKKKKR